MTGGKGFTLEPPFAETKNAQFWVTFELFLTTKMVNQNKEHSLFAIDNKQRQSTGSISNIVELSGSNIILVH